MPPTIFIGDVHGRSDLLLELLSKIQTLYGDCNLYHLGDLVDRGSDSKGVIDLCLEHDIQGILGNHEIWLHKLLATGEFDPFALDKHIQGGATLDSYGVHQHRPNEEVAQQMLEAVPASHRDYILSLPVWRRVEAGGKVYRLIHTGLKQETAEAFLPAAMNYANLHGKEVNDTLVDLIAEHSPAHILWLGNSWKNPQLYAFTDGSVQVLGHSPTPHGEPYVTPHWVAVDCGCGVRRSVLGGFVVLPDGSTETVTVNGVNAKGVGKAALFTDFTI